MSAKAPTVSATTRRLRRGPNKSSSRNLYRSGTAPGRLCRRMRTFLADSLAINSCSSLNRTWTQNALPVRCGQSHWNSHQSFIVQTIGTSDIRGLRRAGDDKIYPVLVSRRLLSVARARRPAASPSVDLAWFRQHLLTWHGLTPARRSKATWPTSALVKSAANWSPMG